jgi:hypothetical protein
MGGKSSTENKLGSKDQQPINSNIVMFSFPPSILSSAQYSIVLTYEYSNPFSITENKRTKQRNILCKGCISGIKTIQQSRVSNIGIDGKIIVIE